MTYNTPLRLTILHLAHRFLMEEDTFMISYSFAPVFDGHRYDHRHGDYIDPGVTGHIQPKSRLYLSSPFSSRSDFSWGTQIVDYVCGLYGMRRTNRTQIIFSTTS